MKQKNSKTVSVVIALALLAGAGVAGADQVIYAKKKGGANHGGLHGMKATRNAQGGFDLGKGWELTSTGGLSYVNPQDDRHWFKLSGVARLDETLFMGNTTSRGTNYHNGANIRALEAYLDGGVGQNWVYNLSLSFDDNNANFSDVYVSYLGLIPNNQIYVGRVSGNWFGLDSANSTSWNPFLERSLGTLAFYPGDGLGLMTDFWGENWGFTVSATQPDHAASTPQGVTDRWKAIARATIAPVHEEGDVWHFGVSGMHRELPTGDTSKGLSFATVPGARARNVSASNSIINTTLGNGMVSGGTRLPLQANYAQLFNLEMARQYGPWMLEAEYTHAYAHRTPNRALQPVFLGSVAFQAWNVQTRYLLTGESHAYDVRDGNFGSVKPMGSYGAVELAARYDYINLADKDVNGGSAHDLTLGLNWFLNQQLRLSANYVQSNIHAASNAVGAAKRKLDIIGLRCQLRFK